MKNIPLIFFLGLTTLMLVGLFYISLPLVLPIILAFILTHFCMPIKTFLRKSLSNTQASVVTFLLAFTFVIGPLVGISILVSNEARNFYALVTSYFNDNDNDFFNIIQGTYLYQKLEENGYLASLEALLQGNSIKDEIIGAVNVVVTWLVRSLRAFLVNLPTFIVNVFLWIYLTFFLIKDGDKFFNTIKGFLPLAEEEKDQVVKETVKMINATLYGTVLVGLIEGFLGGVIFAILGIPGAVTWGVAMAILTMIPIVGANGILGPASIYFLVTGNISTGLFILILGCGTVGIIEYIIKPKIMGDRANVHPSIIAVSVLGGIYRMGLLGVIIGPVLAILTIALLKMFRRKLLLSTASESSNQDRIRVDTTSGRTKKKIGAQANQSD
ncbi:hypothetical protein COTS27_00004 [Spirochaetota bacterium]|nr:hypothetical protein COTS27_00004 [Spirochaetota bacterium]